MKVTIYVPKADGDTIVVKDKITSVLHPEHMIFDSDDRNHGYWMDINYIQDRIYANCSYCKQQVNLNTLIDENGTICIDSQYCPKCGARMDGYRHDEN